MNVICKIIEVFPDQHSVTVRYYADTVPEDALAVNFNRDGSIMRRDDGSPFRCMTDLHKVITEVPAPQGPDLYTWLFKNVPPNMDVLRIQELRITGQLDDISAIKQEMGAAVAYVAVPALSGAEMGSVTPVASV